jgi:hypothetical protein
LSQRNSKIRVPDGQRLLRQKCRSINRFHPKTFVFDAQEAGTEQPFGVFLGSANLTFSGLHSGTEHGTSILWHPPFNTQDKKLLDSTIASLEWWNRAWEEADIVADSFIEKYREIRPQRIMTEDDNELVKMFSAVGKQLVEIQEGIGWATSRCFWIETHELYKNLGATRPGNQVDCRRGTRIFFGFSPIEVPKNTVLGEITVQYEDKKPVGRSIRYGNNQMDKVNLPIPNEEGPPSYDFSVLHFERIGAKRFKLRLARGDEKEQWRRKSKEQGMYYTFVGEREYGFYS